MAATTPKPGPYSVGPLLVVSGLAWGGADDQLVDYFKGEQYYTAPVRTQAQDVGDLNSHHDLTPAANDSDVGFPYQGSAPLIAGIVVDMGPTVLPRQYEYTDEIAWFVLQNRFVRGYWSGAPTEHVINNLDYFQTPAPSDPTSGLFQVEAFSDMDPRHFNDGTQAFDTPVVHRAAYLVVNQAVSFDVAINIDSIANVQVAADQPVTLARLRSHRVGVGAPGDASTYAPIYHVWPAVANVEVSYARRNGDGPVSFTITTTGLAAGTYPITVRAANGRNTSWSEASFTVTAQ